MSVGNYKMDNVPKNYPSKLINGKEIFALSMISNFASSSLGSTGSNWDQQTLNGKLDAVNKQYNDSNWECVWGPGYYATTNSKGKAVNSNTMFIAQDKNMPEQFIVAIAGTDAASVYDWNVEDFAVNTQTQLVSADEANNELPEIDAVVSKGTHKGVHRLLSRLEDANKKNIDPISYLKGIKAKVKNACITVTGHSLGGALSPAFAAILAKINENTSSWANIVCLASAGATPGADSFFKFFKENNIYYNILRNTNDVVPHAWNNLGSLPDYNLTLDSDSCVKALIGKANGEIDNNNNIEPYTWFTYPSEGQPGVCDFASEIHDMFKKGDNDKADAKYLIAALYNHVYAYLEKVYGENTSTGNDSANTWAWLMDLAPERKYSNKIIAELMKPINDYIKDNIEKNLNYLFKDRFIGLINQLYTERVLKEYQICHIIKTIFSLSCTCN